ncbi:rhomboid family intramembrane serine protease [Aestuariivirga sp.]|uniref:rhomboid family intramembrane serine protease n=1 Tax=Aestuariivirga sp. TaxID=2650926 RepID=UPI00391A13F0
MPEQNSPRVNWNRGAAGPAINAPPAVLAVIGGLVLVHVLLNLLGENWRVWSLFALALIPARFTDPGFPMIEGSQYWSLASYMLLHGDWMHLFFNSLWLLIFGTPVGRYLGSGRFLALCLLAGLAGGLSSLALHWGEEIFVIGASGAVSGLLAAAIPIMYARPAQGGGRPLSFGELVSNPRALMFSGVWLALTLFSGAAGWTGNSFAADSGIAWEAHIGGFLGGLAAFYALARRAVRPA